MELLLNSWKYRKKLEIYYPPDQLETWELLRSRYVSLGYKWIDFSMNQNYLSIYWADRKNQKKYEKRKRNERKYINSVRNDSYHIKRVIEAPRPNNVERYVLLRSWMVKNAYNLCNISVFLFEKYKLKPCKDYNPDRLIEVYNHYSNLYSDTITRSLSRNLTSTPSAPPVTTKEDLPPLYDYSES